MVFIHEKGEFCSLRNNALKIDCKNIKMVIIMMKVSQLSNSSMRLSVWGEAIAIAFSAVWLHFLSGSYGLLYCVLLVQILAVC